MQFRMDRVLLGSTLRIDLQFAGAQVAADGPLDRTCAEGGFDDHPETLVASFSRILVRAVSGAREVSRSTKTGRRLNPAVARVVASLSRKPALGENSSQTQGSHQCSTSDLMVLEDAPRISTGVLDVPSGSDLEEMRTPAAPWPCMLLAPRAHQRSLVRLSSRSSRQRKNYASLLRRPSPTP